MVEKSRKSLTKKMGAKGAPTRYVDILECMRDLTKTTQLQAIADVNRSLISTYWMIGKMLHEQQQANTEWGDSIVDHLSRDLQHSFPGMKGFSARNLWRMKDFYQSYYPYKKTIALLSDISWTHHMVILEKCEDFAEREFYMRISKRNGWSYRVLMNQINNKIYEKTLALQTNFDRHLPETIVVEAKLSMKDDYAFDFLELADKHAEYELKQAILSRVEDFLREMGDLFSFMGSQYTIEVGDQECKIDMLLFHRRLKCLVALELKIGSFVPEYVGQMQVYLSVLDNKVRLCDENPSIGIILCKSKNKIIVEYAFKDVNKPINVASYHVVKDLPKELEGQLPSPEQLAKLLEFIESPSNDIHDYISQN